MILCSQLLAGEYELSSCITETQREREKRERRYRETSRAARDGVRRADGESRRGHGPFHTANEEITGGPRA